MASRAVADAELHADTEPTNRPTPNPGAANEAEGQPRRVGSALVVSATFTAEPLEPTLRFWLAGMGLDASVEFAPYNQVLPQLLDPSSALGRNVGGVNVVLVRLEDWSRFLRDPTRDEASVLERGVDDLAAALRAYASRPPAPLVLAVCPPSPSVSSDPARAALHASAEERIRAAAASTGVVHWLGRDDLARYPVPGDPYDPRRDAAGHMPHTPAFDTALATALARRIHALRFPRAKVLALDCDNTLWKGVVGEDGPTGVTIPPGARALQRFAVAAQDSGVLICLASKNVESDVLAVFDAHPDMPLRREHVVAMRVDWLPKAENLRALAAELNLGLDSFVFLDDNPVECAAMRAACPGVITLQVPGDDAAIPAWLGHIWPLDATAVTDEDRRRTAMYRQNSQRDQFERAAGGIEAFLAGLELRIAIAPPNETQWARVAQLTQRTNQFNLTTVRRAEAEVRRGDLEWLAVEVSDRFGDYGLVGVLGLADEPDAIRVDTMLLSCRVLGRGVEHAMLADVGRLARERGKSRVDLPFIPTAKNQPARDFLESLAGSDRETDAQGRTVHRLPAEMAEAVRYSPGADAAAQLELARERPKTTTATTPAATLDRSAFHDRVANALRDVAAIEEAVVQAFRTTRPELDTPHEPPRDDLERTLAGLWERILGLDRVGIHDDFTALGGKSLEAARLFVEIDERFGRKLPMTTILDAPTVARLAERMRSTASGAEPTREIARLLRPGSTEFGPALFLAHDGDGETLLYLNLARRMPEGVAVYGIEPLADERCPMRHTRLPDMAARYLEEVRRIQPEGPYLLGGMCAGGTIAYEMARQLRAEGLAVGMVALLDPAAPGTPLRVGREASARWERFSRAMQDDTGSPLARLGRKALKAARKARNLAAYELSRRWTTWRASSRFQALRRATDAGRPTPRSAAGLTVRQIYVRAEREYRPEGALDAPVVLFRASEGVDADTPFVEIFADPLLGWGPLVRGGPEVVDMPGGHSSMLQEPNVAVMAARLARCLEPVAEPVS